MKRMLFNATQAEELRVAIVDGQKLIDLDIETVGKEQRKSNIYKAIITRIEPSLEACFVDYGTDRHGFLPFKEVARAYFKEGADSRSRIQDALKEGMELIVQVEKDERGNKGAALTTFISLAGRYLVLMPNNPRGGGVSRRIEGEERQELRATMDQLDVPSGMSIIARTAGIGRSAEELQWDLNYLLQLWRAIENAGNAQKGPFLIYQEGSLVIRAIRDYYQPDIGEILIDTEFVYEQAQQFMSHVMPGFVNRVKLYKDDVPLFSRFQIEHQIETAFSREVGLPSGGAIVIDHTEALVSVDVNSARATKGGDIEETATRTNLEAADEIARQLRLRDLGGLIVVDFIDMEKAGNQREVENRLRDALRHDRARVQTGKISRFGLMELSRQRLQPSLGETAHQPCPRCHGTGFIRGTESSALHILRIIQEEAMKENTGAIHVQVPVDVATFLLNEKRAEIFSVESRLKVSVVLIPNIHLETPNYQLARLRHDDLNHIEEVLPSYKMMEAPVEEAHNHGKDVEPAKPRQEAAVKGITPTQPAPVAVEKTIAEPAQPSLFDRIVRFFTGDKVEEVKQPTPANKTGGRERNNSRRNEGRRERNNSERNAETRNEPRRNEERRPGGKPRIEEDEQPRPSRESRPRGEPKSDRQDNRNERPQNEAREPRPPRENQEAKPEREPRQPREQREPRNEREPRPEREPREPKAEREPRPEREPRTEREPRQERQPRPVAEAKFETKADANFVNATEPSQQELLPTDSNNAEAMDGSEGRGRRRRGRRGGRSDRNDSQPSLGENAEAGENAPAESTVANTIETPALVTPSPVVEAATVPRSSPVEMTAAPVAEEAKPALKPVEATPMVEVVPMATEAIAQVAPPTVIAEAPAKVEAVTPPALHEVPVPVATIAPLLPAVKAPVVEVSPAPIVQPRPGQAPLEIGRPEDTGMVQVNTQLKSFEPVEIKVEAATRRRRSDVKPLDTSAPARVELVMVETSHGDKA
ncbi:Rne/Rng family ribonuclease [Chitinimonas sp. BJB300]|uniref:Rne/Rng family ribonuclease n=1 Tax=Chitinimonas sp. BJB300 TaxID=1559339 RepID=UPI000C102F15|nr:Rne/Rng family ribonuclease [Chitinimonas sp. BJB300]PHV13014.1 ribonuclease E/G [Chitinimonas sp. BJB300]TSJ88929.1 Rne/Rng family ribonuclease [Chitinimonas sp. BJB300]